MSFTFDRGLVVLTALIGLMLGPVLPGSAQGWPPEVKNRQHFPEDTDFRQLMGTMRGFAFGLGVRCQYCRVGEEGQPLARFDFASDEKETKLKARLMLEMVEAINGEHLKKLDVEPSNSVQVQCVTCHRGVARPEQLRDILVGVGSSEGAEAAVARYRELREEHYGSGSYGFGEATLIRAAETLAGSEELDGAVALLQESLGHTPESAWALRTLAGVENKRGNSDAAIAALEKILEFEPDNAARVQKQIEMLSKPVEEPPEGADGDAP